MRLASASSFESKSLNSRNRCSSHGFRPSPRRCMASARDGRRRSSFSTGAGPPVHVPEGGRGGGPWSGVSQALVGESTRSAESRGWSEIFQRTCRIRPTYRERRFPAPSTGPPTPATLRHITECSAFSEAKKNPHDGQDHEHRHHQQNQSYHTRSSIVTAGAAYTLRWSPRPTLAPSLTELRPGSP